jgi:hypothetical protein
LLASPFFWKPRHAAIRSANTDFGESLWLSWINVAWTGEYG